MLPSVLMAAVFLVGCADSTGSAPALPSRLIAPEFKVGDEPGWTGKRDGEPIVAQVSGIPIPEGRYLRALKSAASGSDPRMILDEVVADEMIAQQAALVSPEGRLRSSVSVYQRALVSRLLRERLVEVFHPDDVPIADLQVAFSNPQVSGKFNHARLFTIQDYQWICCGGDAKSCAAPDVEPCFNEGTIAMSALREALDLDTPESEDIPLLVEKWQAMAPRLAYQEYDFAYDDERQMQRGSILFDDNVVRAAVATPEGRFAEKVVRSGFGLHIMYVKEMLPPVRKGLDAPEVRLDIAEFFFARFQQKRLIDYLVTLIPFEPFRMLKGAVPKGSRAERPRYDVVLYPETMTEALEADARLKEKEPI